MKLNAHIICDDLGDVVTSSRIVDNKLTRKLIYPMLFEADLVLQDSIIYIACSASLPEKVEYQGVPCLICIGAPPETYYKSRINIIVVMPDVPLFRIFNRVSKIFGFYQVWQDGMQEIINRDQSIEKFGELAEPIFQNPICLIDSISKVLFATTAIEKYKLPKHYVVLEANTIMPPEDINILKMDEEFTKATEHTTPTIYPSDLYGYRTLYQNVFISGQYFARILIDEIEKKFTERDSALLYALQEYISYYLIKENLKNFMAVSELDEIIIRLLGNNMIPEKKIESALQKKGWTTKDSYVFIVVEGSSHDIENNTLGPLSLLFGALLPNLYTIVYNNTINIIMNLSKPKISKQDALNTIWPNLRDSFLKAGVSRQFNEFGDLYYYYRQSMIALNIGSIKNPTFWYFDFSDYSLDFILRQATNDLPADTFCSVGLLRLIAHDHSQKTDYVHILLTYLQTNMSIVESTRLLYMHRNTFLYRLNRIEEILKMDLTNPDIRLMLLITIKMLDNEK